MGCCQSTSATKYAKEPAFSTLPGAGEAAAAAESAEARSRRISLAIGPSTNYPIEQYPGYKTIYEKWEHMEEPVIEIEAGSHQQVYQKAYADEKWGRRNMRELVDLMDDLGLIDLAFLIECIEEGVPLPRQQEVPKGAIIAKDNLDKIKGWPREFDGIGILVLSYPWRAKGHPDLNQVTCKKLLNVLKEFLALAKRNGDHFTMGVMWDYLVLPQKRIDGTDDRTEAQKEKFSRALHSMNTWYMHQFTYVLVFDVEIDDPRPYLARGWCQFELRASGLIKHSQCLCSLAGWEAGGYEAAVGGTNRKPPMAPPAFAEMLDEGSQTGSITFTCGKADLDTVVKQYELAFEGAFKTTEILYYAELDWSDEEMKELARALTYAKQKGLLDRTTNLCVFGNDYTKEGRTAVKLAIQGTRIHLMEHEPC